MNILQRARGSKSKTTLWGGAYQLVMVVAGCYAFAISALGSIAFDYGYRPEAHSAILFIGYFQHILVFPFFLIALIPRKWATLPLWAVCLSICCFPYVIHDAQLRTLFGYGNNQFDLRDLKGISMVMVIPAAVQTAVWLRSRHNALLGKALNHDGQQSTNSSR